MKKELLGLATSAVSLMTIVLLMFSNYENGNTVLFTVAVILSVLQLVLVVTWVIKLNHLRYTKE